MTAGIGDGDREGKTCGECKDYFCHCHVDTQAESMDDPNECGNCGRPFPPNNKPHPRVPPELSRTCRTCGLNSTMANHVECHRPAIVACINASYWRPRPQPQVAPTETQQASLANDLHYANLWKAERDRILAVLGDDAMVEDEARKSDSCCPVEVIIAYRARVLAEVGKQI